MEFSKMIDVEANYLHVPCVVYDFQTVDSDQKQCASLLNADLPTEHYCDWPMQPLYIHSATRNEGTEGADASVHV